MGLFHKNKTTSPSGFFTADSSDEESSANRRTSTSSSARRSSSRPRKSVDSTSAAARRSVDTPSSPTTASTGNGNGKTGAAAAAAGAVAGKVEERREEKRENNTAGTGSGITGAGSRSVDQSRSQVPLPAAGANPSTREPRDFNSNVDNSGVAGPRNFSLASSAAGTAVGGQTVHEHARPPAAGTGSGHGHKLAKDAILNVEEAKRAEHDHQYLEAVVHERHHIHEVEEVERHRVVDRHVHHVQHHVQPLLDERHLEVVHSYRQVPVSHIEESHAATGADRALLARLNAQSASTYTVVPHERVRLDKGETQVHENVIHHYHTIVMPVWQRDLHEFYRLNSDFSPSTVIPSAGATPAPYGGAAVQPGGPSMVKPPQAREGYKYVPDKRGATYEVEFVNREPVGAEKVAHHHHQHHSTHSSQPRQPHQFASSSIVSGDAPSAHEHYPSGAHGLPIREATGLSGASGVAAAGQDEDERLSGIDRGVQELGVAR